MLINADVINSTPINAEGEGGLVAFAATYVDGSITSYIATLTGTPDIVLPISNISIRRHSQNPTFLSVVVPNGLANFDDIDARSAGELFVTRTQVAPDGTSISSEIARVELENVALAQGGNRSSIVLDGHKDATIQVAAQRTLSGAQFLSSQNGKLRYRSIVDNDLKPDDVADINGALVLVKELVITVSATQAVMEISDTI